MTNNLHSFEAFTHENEAEGKATNINNCLLMSGFIKHSGFIAFCNDRLGKSRQHKVNRGEVLAVLLLCMANGEYKSILATQEQIKRMPINSYIDLPSEVKPEHLSRDAFADALSALFNYGHELFFREFVFHVVPKMQEGFDPVAVSIDTTTLSTYHSITPKDNSSNNTDDNADNTNTATNAQNEIDEDGVMLLQNSPVKDNMVVPAKAPDVIDFFTKKPIAIRQGHSKNRRTDIGQVIIGTLVETGHGVPLAVTTQSGDKSDKLTFQEMADQLLSAVSEVFTSIKYIVGDSALCTKASFDTVLKQGKHLITRVPDNLNKAKELLKLIDNNSDKLQVINPSTDSAMPLKAYKVRAELHGHPVDLVLVHNPKLSKSKEATIRRRASKEQAELKQKLKESFKCKEDALAYISKLQQSCKYCHITHLADPSSEEGELLFDKKETYSRRGRPSFKEASEPNTKVLKSIRGVCSVEQDESLINKIIEQECRYVLVCTDVEQQLSALEIIRLYKCNALIESLWTLFKSKRMSISTFYFKRVDRIEGLITMMAIAVLSSKLIESKIRQKAASGEVQIPMPDGKKSKYAPTAKRINEFFSRCSVVVIEDVTRSKAIVKGYDRIMFNILSSLGESWLTFIKSSTYKSFSSWVSDLTSEENNS